MLKIEYFVVVRKNRRWYSRERALQSLPKQASDTTPVISPALSTFERARRRSLAFAQQRRLQRSRAAQLPVGQPRCAPVWHPTQVSNHLTLEGSFSAASTATIARKDAFCSIFRDLQDLHSFAPLKSQNFSKKRVQHFARMKWNEQNFISFLQKFDEFLRVFCKNLTNFCRNFTRNCRKLQIFYRFWENLPEKIGKMSRYFWKLCRFHSSISFFQSYP